MMQNKNIHFQIAKKLADLLDNRFEILGIKFGLDPILDIIPWAGDVIAAVLGFYIVYVANVLKLPQSKVNRMILNIVIDYVIGLIPYAGPVATVFFRSNQMNIKIIEEFLRDANIEEGEIIG